jgi:hypothetical protein
VERRESLRESNSVKGEASFIKVVLEERNLMIYAKQHKNGEVII